ncbi:MAG: UDP-3-O-(3-hydroxymyristoyl)glucosamine N-acyltransferase [Thermodesulfobacteriota bacterium]
MEKKKLTLQSLAELVDGELAGDGSVEIDNLNTIEDATPSEICFVVKAAQADGLENCNAGAAIVPREVESGPMPLIRVRDPYFASAIIQNHLLARPFVAEGVHARAHVAENCELGREISIGPMAVLGKGVRLGERVRIDSGSVIGDGVEIGDDCWLKANVTVEHGCRIGSRVTIHPGTVIGSDGYGYATDSRGFHVKRPQLGIVVIEDDVEIGANCCVDRATFGETRIKSGTKIDNLVQVAHNVVVGENSFLVAQVGIAGSTTLGRNVALGGQSAVAGHLKIGDMVMAAAKSGIHSNLESGAKVGGIPAIPMKKFARVAAAIPRLPEIIKELRRLRKDVAALKEENQ